MRSVHFSQDRSMAQPVFKGWVALLLLTLALPGHADKPPSFLGDWVINQELTAELAPKLNEPKGLPTLGGGRAQVSVMGIPIPTGGRARRSSNGPRAQDPGVLACNEMRIETEADQILMTYKGVGSEKLKSGEYRGRKTKWTRNNLVQTYKTTERKVTKKWEMRKDGRLLVTVTLNPKGDKKRKFKRVFDRAGSQTAAEPT